eukprot:CAMPEP_0175247234 /NCGR_PEP_ID=MMETSP0093-20121207/33517_1 /TAXON_ID=311494 /ORGANISM="Alexandrium monilatum, Strain CCMP3105" /LENGTH=256 /DNA_ID=CAMNT_0016541411 /DNA_START=148 /DNA_END=915 /DNA_ORIENTATION=-
MPHSVAPRLASHERVMQVPPVSLLPPLWGALQAEAQGLAEGAGAPIQPKRGAGAGAGGAIQPNMGLGAGGRPQEPSMGLGAGGLPQAAPKAEAASRKSKVHTPFIEQKPLLQTQRNEEQSVAPREAAQPEVRQVPPVQVLHVALLVALLLSMASLALSFASSTLGFSRCSSLTPAFAMASKRASCSLEAFSSVAPDPSTSQRCCCSAWRAQSAPPSAQTSSAAKTCSTGTAEVAAARAAATTAKRARTIMTQLARG